MKLMILGLFLAANCLADDFLVKGWMDCEPLKDQTIDDVYRQCFKDGFDCTKIRIDNEGGFIMVFTNGKKLKKPTYLRANSIGTCEDYSRMTFKRPKKSGVGAH